MQQVPPRHDADGTRFGSVQGRGAIALTGKAPADIGFRPARHQHQIGQQQKPWRGFSRQPRQVPIQPQPLPHHAPDPFTDRAPIPPAYEAPGAEKITRHRIGGAATGIGGEALGFER